MKLGIVLSGDFLEEVIFPGSIGMPMAGESPSYFLLINLEIFPFGSLAIVIDGVVIACVDVADEVMETELDHSFSPFLRSIKLGNEQ